MMRTALEQAMPNEERIFLWPEGSLAFPDPTPQTVLTEWGGNGCGPDRSIRGILDPWMTVFRPNDPNGIAVLLTPGGAYANVMVDNEGYEVARVFADLGFTVFVLFYRLPGEGWAGGAAVPLADAQRAIRLIRHYAAEHSVDPNQVVACGFSAGGHLCASLAVYFDEAAYSPMDAADEESARPWLAVPVYPVVTMTGPYRHDLCRELLLGKDVDDETAATRSVDNCMRGDAPAHLIIHAEDDPVVPVQNALMLRAALKAKCVPVTCLLTESGGHGFGVRRIAGTELAIWPQMIADWIGRHRLLANR